MAQTYRPLFLAAACAGVAGCGVPAARLQVPPAVVSTEWSEPLAGGSPATRVDAGLGHAFASPELDALIARARARNPDLGIAQARVDQARALLRIARGASLPAVSLSAGAERVTDPSGARAGQGDAYAGLDISYDLDLFGVAAAGRRAGRERLRAASFDREAALVVVEAETARAYLQRAGLAKRLALVERSIAQAGELDRVVRLRAAAGEASRVDLGRQATRLHELRAERERLALALDRTRTALAVLCGEEAPIFRSEPGAIDALAVPSFAVADPTTLLVQRPDVRAAEALIAAAGGDVQAARAAFFPRIRLSAGAFLQSAGGAGPLQALASLGAGLLAPIFDRGRLRGEYDGATARQAESVELYRRTLLTALAEVEDARAATNRTGAREAIVAQTVAAARETARLSRLQYANGAADLFETIAADDALVAAEDALALARQDRLEAAIDLFRAAGGRLG